MKQDRPDPKAIFADALRFSVPTEREAYLDRACSGQPALRQELDSLLNAYLRRQSGEFPVENRPLAAQAWCEHLETKSAPSRVLDEPGDEALLGDSPLAVPRGELEQAFRPNRQQFGEYELVEEIAHGAMGVIYKAWQVRLKRMVALKMILRGQYASSAEVSRFLLEAQAAAHLNHPNIVPIYEVGQHDGQHFFSMQLIEGRSLAEQLQAGAWPLDDGKAAARLLVKVARAVHYAHEAGILHRDMKPANILIDSHAILGYGLLLLDQVQRAGPLPQPHWHVIFVLALILAGGIISYLVHRVCALTRFSETKT